MFKGERLTFSELVKYLKKYAFSFSHGKIYNGVKNVYDFGPLGTDLKNKLQNLWREHFINQQSNIHEMDSAILTHHLALEASGHADKFQESQGWKFSPAQVYSQTKNNLPLFNSSEFYLPFGLLLNVPLVNKNDPQIRYLFLRPETAQGIFMNMKDIWQAMKLKLPFGLAQIGKAFRKEANSAHFFIRAWEFEQMELEYFFDGTCPSQRVKVFDFWSKQCQSFFLKKLSFSPNLIRKQKAKKHIPHYSQATEDWEFQLSNGEWLEIASLSDRGQYDLHQHQIKSTCDLTLKNEQADKLIPHVIEPSFGVGRLMFAFLSDRLRKEKNDHQKERLVLHLPAQMAYYQIAVLPLTESLTEEAKVVYKQMQQNKTWRIHFTIKKSIGTRYLYHDAIGTKYCLTYDFESHKTQTVTIRERDTRKQQRIHISELNDFFCKWI